MPALGLTGAQFEQLGRALGDAFPAAADLTLLLKFKLDKNLTDYASLALPYTQILFYLIQAAEAQGWTAELVGAARAENPGNDALRAFADSIVAAAAARHVGAATPASVATGVANHAGQASRQPAVVGGHESAIPTSVSADAAPAIAAVHGFLTATGFDRSDRLAVAVVVVLENPEAVRNELASLRDDLLHDPVLRATPSVFDLRKRLFDYDQDDAEVKARLLETLARMSFEAYVWYLSARQPDTDPRPLARTVRGLLRDRLSAERTRVFRLHLDPSLEPQRQRIRELVIEAAADIRRSDKRGVQEPVVEPEDRQEMCVAVARYTAAIVAERLTSADALERRAFDRLHPSKIRLIHEVGSKRFYTRNNALR